MVARGGLIGAADWTDEHSEALADLAIGRFASRPLLRQIDLSHLADDHHRQLAVRRVQVQTVVAAEKSCRLLRRFRLQITGRAFFAAMRGEGRPLAFFARALPRPNPCLFI